MVYRHQTQINAQLPGNIGQAEENTFNVRQYKKYFISMFLVYGMSLVCYTPYLVVSAIELKLLKHRFPALYAARGLAQRLMFVNSAINPIVYCWRFQAIRTAVKETARKL